jgi:hypothetical protein
MRTIMNTCLLLKTKSGRSFLAHEKSLPHLIEYTKTFGAEIYRVEAESDQKVLELKALVAAICDQDYASSPKHKKLEKVHPKAKKDRETILKTAATIRKYIRRRLLSGKEVSLKELKTKYKDCKVTDACLCSHFAAMRKILGREGHSFEKKGAGKYCIV